MTGSIPVTPIQSMPKTWVSPAFRVPTPQECGLPEKFDAWRPQQEEALHFLERSTTRATAPCIPTGGGKSPLLIAKALRSKKVTAIVTDSKPLQDQYLNDFGDLVVDFRGRNNYTCVARDGDADYTCEHGHAASCPYKGSPQCPYSAAEFKAASSSVIITNYAKWTKSRKYGLGLGHVQQVFFDEGHEAKNALAQGMQITLHHKEIEETLEVPFPDQSEAEFFSTWRPWAGAAKSVAEGRMAAAREHLKSGDKKGKWVREYVHMRNLLRNLSVLSTAAVDNWIVEEFSGKGGGYVFDPINPIRYAETTLLLKVPDILVTSATLKPKDLYMMGLRKEDITYREFPSTFDPARCPIYYIPTMRVDYRAGDLKSLWLKVDQIAKSRRDRNGVLHAVSFDRGREYLAASKYAPYIFYHQRGQQTTHVVEDFVLGYPGAILVSPSVGQGFDFAYERAEWQFISKCPFPPPSKILQARMERDKELRYAITIQKLDQMVGRLMRYPDDLGETFIADDHIQWLKSRYSHLGTSTLWKRFKEVPTIPRPPERLSRS